MEKRNSIVAAVVVAVGIIVLGLCIRGGLKSFTENQRVVTVKGLAEREVKADKAIWPIVFKEVGNNLPALYKTVEQKNKIVIDKLKEYKIIDDSEYAKAFIRSNANNSKLRLKKKLSQSGVDKKFIEQELENVDEFESCFNNAKKFFKSKDINKDSCEKLTRRLSYQGYSWETIKKVLNKLTDIEFEDY